MWNDILIGLLYTSPAFVLAGFAVWTARKNRKPHTKH